MMKYFDKLKKNFIPYFFLGAAFCYIVIFASMHWIHWSSIPPKEESTINQGASLSIVSIGERFEHSDVQFIVWESLTKEKQIDIKNSEEIFLFSQKSFENKQNEALINELIDEKKLVLFYGYRMDVENILSTVDAPIPFYPFESSKEIYFYLYGVSYSWEHEEYVPVTVLGNFSQEVLGDKIVHFLTKKYSSKEN